MTDLLATLERAQDSARRTLAPRDANLDMIARLNAMCALWVEMVRDARRCCQTKAVR